MDFFFVHTSSKLTVMSICAYVAIAISIQKGVQIAVEVEALAIKYEYGLNSSKRKKIPLLVTDHLILPGETKTLWTDEVGLIEHSLSNNFGVLATGIFVGNEELMEVASLCEIRDCGDVTDRSAGPFRGERADADADGNEDEDENADADGHNTGARVFLTLECVGRVKLGRMSRENSNLEFDFTLVEDQRDHLKDCQLVAENIETFMKILSRPEKEVYEGAREHSIRNIEYEDEDDDDDFGLLARYKEAYDRSIAVFIRTKIASSSDHADINSLVATSWAAFTAMEDKSINLRKYRLRALDYGNLFDRLKLAQYMLREKELRLQGMSLDYEKFANDDDHDHDDRREDINGSQSLESFE